MAMFSQEKFNEFASETVNFSSEGWILSSGRQCNFYIDWRRSSPMHIPLIG